MERGQNLRSSFATGADAVGDADAAIAVARQRQPRQLTAKMFDALQAVKVADAILGHRRHPFIYAGPKRLGAESEDFLQVFADEADNLAVGKLPDLVSVRTSDEAAQQGTILRSTTRKLIVDERCGQHEPAFAARHQKSEARRQRLTHLAAVAQPDRDGRAITDAAELVRQLRARRGNPECATGSIVGVKSGSSRASS